MIKIVYPPYQPKIKKEDNKEFIFDEVRKQWVMLTPEEWVRQNFLQYLIHVQQYPASLIAIEKEMLLNDLKKRTDIIVYDKATKPWMIVECKEMNVALDEKVMQQILRYHQSIAVPYLVITNGSFCFGFEKVLNDFIEINQLPFYK
ncbi:MAG: type I restriction enzyme HsdR N-terminal domain-containing protein [Ferruginibacter sp.]